MSIMSHKEKYRHRMNDCSIDTTVGPPGAMLQLNGCYYKVSRGKAWRWNSVAKDWTLSTKEAEYITSMVRAKSDKENNSNGV